MTRVALCLTGHIRNLVANYPNLKANILDRYEPDIFIHSWDTYGWRAEGNLIQLGHGGFKGFDHYSGKVNQEEIISLLQPKKYLFESFLTYEQQFHEQALKHKPNCGHPKDRPENTISMAYTSHRAIGLKTEHELANGFKYDVVIKTRPDMVYGAPLFDVYGAAHLVDLGFLLTPEAESYGTASDILAIGNSETIDRYATLYKQLDEINAAGCNMNPHHVMKFFFEKNFPGKWRTMVFPIALNRCRKQCPGQLSCAACDPTKQILSNIIE